MNRDTVEQIVLTLVVISLVLLLMREGPLWL